MKLKKNSPLRSALAKRGRKIGFTIIELLTVMSIIVILIALLVPALNMARRYAMKTVQEGQFSDIRNGLEGFSGVLKGKLVYLGGVMELPDSSERDPNGDWYCGAMKLCETMAGQDGLGLHSNSRLMFGGGPGVNPLYPTPPPLPWPDWYKENLRKREHYMEDEDIKVHTLGELWGNARVASDGPFDPCCVVLCDVFRSVKIKEGPNRGERTGMPILYYKANTSNLLHNIGDTEDPGNIYDYKDNHLLVGLGFPWQDPKADNHPLFQVPPDPPGQVFYEITAIDPEAPVVQPYNKNSYILISAGWDGIYGTGDDVYNFAE